MILGNSEFSNHEVIVDDISKYIDLFGTLDYNSSSQAGFSNWGEISPIIKTRLPEIEREILYKLYFESQTLEHVGQQLNISKVNVLTYRNRAIFRIKIIYQLSKLLPDAKIFLSKYCDQKCVVTMLHYIEYQNMYVIVNKLQFVESKRVTEQAVGVRINNEVERLRQVKVDIKDMNINAAFFQTINILKNNQFLFETKGKGLQMADTKYISRVCDLSEVEINCNKMYDKGYKAINLSDAGSARKFILFEKMNVNAQAKKQSGSYLEKKK